jgi:hypothetical protein
MADLREALAASLESIETQGEVAPAQSAEASPTVVTGEPADTRTPAERARDEAGRFVAKEGEPQAQQAAPEPQAQVQRPSTWKKEYWPLYDKLATGQVLTPEEAKKLADYTNQRENEFKSGVSTYKAEAENAKGLQSAIAPFLPELQRYNIDPGQWISNLGRAHQTLALGSPQEKVLMFQRLAQEYGVPLEALGQQQQQVDPQIQWFSQELGNLKNQWQTFQSAQQQAEQAQIQSQIQAFASDASHPHFEAVKDQMAGLLQSGMAQDLQSAYDKAVRLNDDVWGQVQQQRQAQTTQQAQQAVAKAKAAAVSPKSASPSATGNAAPKGLRAQLEAGLDAALGGGRV